MSIAEEMATKNSEVAISLKEIDLIIEKIRKFDPRAHSIEAWLEKYQMHCDLFNWSTVDSVKRLFYFLDHGLDRLILKQIKNESCELDQNALKKYLINFVNGLLFANKQEYYSDILFILNELQCNGFTNYEKKYWLNRYLPSNKIKEYFEDELTKGVLQKYKETIRPLLD